MSKRFPVGGSKDAVFNFMRQHGFIESNWSDKAWARADGVQARIYGCGSMLQLTKGQHKIADAEILDAMHALHSWREPQGERS